MLMFVKYLQRIDLVNVEFARLGTIDSPGTVITYHDLLIG